jgi:predicted ATPase/DNA-binding winged helix-turn-helix (wHTH) protein
MSVNYRFGGFELRPATRQLLADGRAAALSARAFDVLQALIERRERLVTKDELLEVVWPGLVVEENNLQVHVSALRKLLGPQAIATVAGRGYRFTLPLDGADVVGRAPPTAPPHNLPQLLTRFIGRDSELAVCSGLLEQSRLLTLIGIGGSGKTRLAIRLAEDVLPRFPDGVRFVDLVPLKDAERVALTVATVLKLKEVPDTPLVETLCSHLAARRTLLVLDNCEHLLAAVSALAQALLAATDGLKLLVTSREGLGVDGERRFAVRSLVVPLAEEVAAVEASEAGRLFVDRAQLADAQFTLDTKRAPAVAEICRRLDGIPLALELAAARLQMLSVDEIRARLDDRFRLLVGGKKAALGRQETLRATIQWSYEQLDPEAQRLFRALSVFAGGWTLQGAMAAWGPGADEFTVLELLTRLHDKSLIATVRYESRPTRYSMLETVRELAQELLQAAEETSAARTHHLDYCLSLAGTAETKLRGPEQGEWLARLGREHENLMAAHRWCDEAADGAKKGLRLVSMLSRYWFVAGLHTLGLRVVTEALERDGGGSRTLEREGALEVAARLSNSLGQLAAARTYAEESLVISRTLGSTPHLSSALDVLAAAVAAEDPSNALAYLEEAVALDRELGNKQKLAVGLHNRGEHHRLMGNLDRAIADHTEALALSRETGDLRNVEFALCELAALDIELGDIDTSREHLTEAIRVMIDIADKSVRQDLVEVAGALAMASGDAPRAARTFGAARALRDEAGVRREEVNDRFIQPWLARTRASLGEASFEAAFAAGRALPREEAVRETLAWREQPRAREAPDRRVVPLASRRSR